MRKKRRFEANGNRKLKHLPYGYLGGMNYCKLCWYFTINKGGLRRKLKEEIIKELEDGKTT